jgi:Abnormal spindle-like microcephaly-assoc'd, ASPM-SPD-2-Hydin
MADKRSDVSKISVCLLGVTLAAAALGSGCAGVVMGSNSGSSGSPSGTPPPTKTPQPQVQQPQLAATPMTASFPGVPTGSTSSQTILLQNSGNASVTISSANVTGAGFSTSGLTVPMSIAAGQNATFNVVFAPTSAGNVTGAILLVSDASSSPLAISTSGSAVSSAPLLNPSTGNLDFGSVLVGSTSSLGVLLTNTGNANAVISSVTTTGPGFSVSGVSANTTVPPGQTAALNVTFAPSATGSVTGGITVASNAGSLSINLTGSGGQLSSHTVALNWDPSTSDVVGYFVYRMLPDGTYAKITNAPVVLTAFTDASIQSGQTYTYVVTAVDADNVESDFSDPAVAVIP